MDILHLLNMYSRSLSVSIDNGNLRSQAAIMKPTNKQKRLKGFTKIRKIAVGGINFPRAFHLEQLLSYPFDIVDINILISAGLHVPVPKP